MDYRVCLECNERFPDLFGTRGEKCPHCEHPMSLYETAATPVTPDSPIILTGLVPKTKD